jgi:tight adherence protein B
MKCRALIIASIALLLALPGIASAQNGSLVVRDVSVAEFPRVNLAVDIPVSDGTPEATFSVMENGHEAEVLTAEAVQADPMDVFLVLDTSGSMKGASLDAAKAAAMAFAEELQDGSRVAVVAFSATARLVSPILAPESSAVEPAIGGLSAEGETALYDALQLTAEEASRAGAKRPIAVLLSDGGDTVSRSSLDDAVKSLRAAGLPVLVVALPSAEADSGVLETIASQTGGRFVGVAEAAALADVYQELARGLQTTWSVTYVSRRPATKDIDVVLTATDEGNVMSGSALVPNPLFDASASTGVQTLEAVPPASVITLTGAGLLVFVSVFALLVSLVLLLMRPRTALDQMKYYDQLHESGETPSVGEDYSGKVTSSLVGALDYIAGKRGMRKFIYEQLDRAGWPLRPTEYMTLHLVTVIAVGVVTSLVSGTILVGFLAVLVATVVPLVILDNRIRNRRSAFERQLPDVLNLIAGALRAGWGLQQSIDLVVEQMSPPVSTEFARAQTEIRLGRSVEDALGTVAKRTQSEDFTWVVTAIGIQRDVGGNLAEVLDVVAATIRDRGALKRQISGLTAEGRLSAWILMLLPFVLVGLIAVVNPVYLSGLFATVPGLIMVFIGGALLIIGAIWLRNVVTIEV